jgi:hypothetical protein
MYGMYLDIPPIVDPVENEGNQLEEFWIEQLSEHMTKT